MTLFKVTYGTPPSLCQFVFLTSHSKCATFRQTDIWVNLSSLTHFWQIRILPLHITPFPSLPCVSTVLRTSSSSSPSAALSASLRLREGLSSSSSDSSVNSKNYIYNIFCWFHHIISLSTQTLVLSVSLSTQMLSVSLSIQMLSI